MADILIDETKIDENDLEKSVVQTSTKQKET